LKGQDATLKDEHENLKPDLQSRLVKIENQAVLYGTSWKVLQDSQDLLAEELKSIKSKNTSPKVPWMEKNTPSERAPPVSSLRVQESWIRPPGSSLIRSKIILTGKIPSPTNQGLFHSLVQFIL